MSSITQGAAWQDLQTHFEEIKNVTMKSMFTDDSKRFEKFSLGINGGVGEENEKILFDFSKNRINDETLTKLLALAKEAKVQDWARRMYSGEKINSTEGRAVLHIALRNRSNTPIIVDGKNVTPEVNKVIDQMTAFSTAVLIY